MWLPLKRQQLLIQAVIWQRAATLAQFSAAWVASLLLVHLCLQDKFPLVKGLWVNTEANIRGKKISGEILQC